MLTTKEAIEQRRSIRKFKPDLFPDEYLYELLEAARLAPSGCNAQPWGSKDDNIYVVALLPIGYPAESPQARKRLTLQEIMIE